MRGRFLPWRTKCQYRWDAAEAEHVAGGEVEFEFDGTGLPRLVGVDREPLPLAFWHEFALEAARICDNGARVVNDPPLSFGELLREHRRATGLTQEELAERASVSPRTISELERGGAHVPRRDTVALLARALGLSGPAREAFEGVVVRRRRVLPHSASQGQAHMEQLETRAPSLPDRPKHNLPRSLTSFIGREREMSELAPVLAGAPLLTLVGTGGVGKTRLAQQLVREHSASYDDGSWLVELGRLSDASLVPGAVGAALGLRDFQARNTMNMLSEYLGQKHLLLVLDGCEHLVAACAELVAHLLRICPRLHVLATSREPLAIAGEITSHVLPLELPDPRQRLSSDQIIGTAAVRLFIERAHLVNNTLVLTDESTSAIARICVAVAGIPLALELAAARTRMLTVEQLAERLEHDSPGLSGANRAGLPQHRTIRATIDWSHDLLGQQEQILLRRLSVFAGGWALDTAEYVCSGADVERAEVLDLLAQLVDKSMALVDTRETVARYRLLEPIRQYAMDRLVAADESTVYRARHATAFLELARTAPGEAAGPDEISALDRLEVEHDNLRAALRWAIVHQETEAALRSASALFRFWERRGHFQEGCAWLEQALALPGAGDAPAGLRARALNALAFLYWRGGDAKRAQHIAGQALAAARDDGTSRFLAQALLNVGMTAYLEHEHEVAVERLTESVRFAREDGNPPLLSLALTFLARTRLWLNGPLDAGAVAALEESLALAQAAQSRYATGHALATLGDLLWGRGAAERALPLWREALEVVSELDDRRGIAGCLERLAWVLAASGRLEPAAWLFGVADAQHRLLGMELRHGVDVDHAHFVAVTQRHLGEAFADAWSAGQKASLDEAVTRALEGTRWLPTEGLNPRRVALRLGRDQNEPAGRVSVPRPRVARVSRYEGQSR